MGLNQFSYAIGAKGLYVLRRAFILRLLNGSFSNSLCSVDFTLHSFISKQISLLAFFIYKRDNNP